MIDAFTEMLEEMAGVKREKVGEMRPVVKGEIERLAEKLGRIEEVYGKDCETWELNKIFYDEAWNYACRQLGINEKGMYEVDEDNNMLQVVYPKDLAEHLEKDGVLPEDKEIKTY